MRGKAAIAIGLGCALAVGSAAIATANPALARGHQASEPRTPSSKPAVHKTKPSQDAVVSQLIVKYKSGVAPTEAPGVATGDRSVSGVDLEPGRAMSMGLRTVELSEPLSLSEAAESAADLASDPRVVHAEPDLPVAAAVDSEGTSAAGPNDFWYRHNYMWNLNGTYGIKGPHVWGTVTGSPDVVVAVLDTGVRAHDDLDPQKQVAGYDMIAVPAVANDGDGRDADPSDPGDWVTSDDLSSGNFSSACKASSSSWHGTHVVGTINARSDNEIGVASVAPGVKTQAVRVLGKCGGYNSDIIDGITWASGGSVSGVPDNPTPAHVINMSLGGAGRCSFGLQAAIDSAVARGTVVVVAAGNSNSQVASSSQWTGHSPANCANTITVAASTSAGKRASFSNYGVGVDLAAPGQNIMSTWNLGYQGPGAQDYAQKSGTSMAAPHVAGLAALLKSRMPSLSPAQIESRLTSRATAFSEGSCDPTPVKSCGTGIASTEAVAGDLPANRPNRPRAVRSESGAIISWAAPLTNGSAVTGYNVQAYSGGTPQVGKTCATTQLADVAAQTECEIVGLEAGTSYTFRVTATTAGGVSLESEDSEPVIKLGPPSAPAAPTAVPGDQRAQVSWSAPTNDGGEAVRVYWVQAYQAGAQVSGAFCSASAVSPAVPTRTCDVEGLTNGQQYTFRVRAGNSDWSALSEHSAAVTPRGRPATPLSPSGVAGNGTVALTWVAPAANGAPIDGYRVQTYAGGTPLPGKTCQSAAVGQTPAPTTCEVSGLVNGMEHTFAVIATNAAGDSDPSARSLPVRPDAPPMKPGAPTATAGADGTVVVSWSNPEQGLTPVSRYTVKTYSGTNEVPQRNCTVPAPSTSCAVADLPTDATYTFTLSATNLIGTSAWSAPSTPVHLPSRPGQTPPVSAPQITVPVAPGSTGGPTAVRSIKVKYSRSKATVMWRAPSAAVTGYQYRISKNGGKTWQAWRSTSSRKAAVKRIKNGRLLMQVAATNQTAVGAVLQLKIK